MAKIKEKVQNLKEKKQDAQIKKAVNQLVEFKKQHPVVSEKVDALISTITEEQIKAEQSGEKIKVGGMLLGNKIKIKLDDLSLKLNINLEEGIIEGKFDALNESFDTKVDYFLVANSELGVYSESLTSVEKITTVDKNGNTNVTLKGCLDYERGQFVSNGIVKESSLYETKEQAVPANRTYEANDFESVKDQVGLDTIRTLDTGYPERADSPGTPDYGTQVCTNTTISSVTKYHGNNTYLMKTTVKENNVNTGEYFSAGAGPLGKEDYAYISKKEFVELEENANSDAIKEIVEDRSVDIVAESDAGMDM